MATSKNRQRLLQRKKELEETGSVPALPVVKKPTAPVIKPLKDISVGGRGSGTFKNPKPGEFEAVPQVEASKSKSGGGGIAFDEGQVERTIGEDTGTGTGFRFDKLTPDQQDMLKGLDFKDKKGFSEAFASKFSGQQDELNKLGNILFDDFEDAPDTLKGVADRLTATDEKELTDFEKSASLTTQIADIKRGIKTEGIKRAESGAFSALTPGREGVLSSLNIAAAKGFSRGVTKQLELISLGKLQLEENIDKTRRKLIEAQQQGKEDLASTLQGAIRGFEKAKATADIELALAQDKGEKELTDSIISDLGTGIGTATDNELLELAGNDVSIYNRLKNNRERVQTENLTEKAKIERETQKTSFTNFNNLTPEQVSEMTAVQASEWDTAMGLSAGSTAQFVLGTQSALKLDKEDRQAALDVLKQDIATNKAKEDKARAETEKEQAEIDEVKEKAATKDLIDLAKNTVDYIKSKEGFRGQAYDDATGKTLSPGEKAKGTATIGYGFTSIDGKPVVSGSNISQSDADGLLKKEISARQTFKDLIDVDLSKSQETALSSFEFNLGSGIWGTTGAGMIEAINKGDFATAANIMKKHNKAQGVVVPGLQTRRNEEAQLLQTEDIIEGSIPGVPVAFERQIKSRVPATLMNSEIELKAINEIIKNTHAADLNAEDAALAFMGFSVDDKADRAYAMNLIDVGLGLPEGVVEDYVPRIANLINRGQDIKAMRLAERTGLKESKENNGDEFIPESRVKAANKITSEIERLLEENKTKIGALGGRETKLSLLVNEIPELATLRTLLLGSLAEVKADFGIESINTKDLLEFRTAIGLDIEQPAGNIAATVATNFEKLFENHNTQREDVGLKRLTPSALINSNARLNLYKFDFQNL